MARNEQLIRQHKVLQLLEFSRFGRTLDELRDDLIADLGLTKLHSRTVRRDLEALQAAGFDIQNETVERGRVYKLGRNVSGVHEIGMSATEMIALSIGRDLLFPLCGTQYWQAIESFWNKVQETVPEGVYEHYQQHRKALYVLGARAKSYEAQAGILKTINRAIVEHRIIEMNYESVGKPARQRRVMPYGLAVYQGSIYAVAVESGVDHDPESTTPERLRRWKLDRIHASVALDEYFTPDEKVDISKHLSKTIGIFSGANPVKVRIRLGEYAVAWVREDPWHPEQTIAPEESGGAILTVPASHPRELLPNVLKLGADAEVLDPAEYRDAVAAAVSTLNDRYQTRDG